MNAHTPQKAPVVERKGARTPFKPKPWAHQDDLRRRVGAEIELRTVDGRSITGTLIGADQFALQVRHKHSVERQSVVTYYKHGLTQYRFVESGK